MVDGTGDGLTVVVAGVGVVACVLGCVVLAEALAEALEVAVPDDDDDDDEAPGERIDGTVDDGEPVQAETVAATRTIKVAQLRTASRGLLAGLAEVMRTLMEPP